MLLAFLIIDKSKFSLFEYFTDKSLANDIIQTIEKIDELEGSHEVADWEYEISPFNDRFYFCLVYKDEQLDQNTKDNLPKLAQNVMKGDKVSLQQVLSAKRITDISHLR